jgi:oligopeptide transport system substrate-binding protein
MKRNRLPLWISIFSAAILLNIPVSTQAAEQSVRIVIDGVPATFDVAPYVKHDRTFIPLRGVLETLGAQVFWESINQQIIIKKDQTFVTLYPRHTEVTVNGKKHLLDAAPEIEQDRTMVPLRFLAESLGADVQWDENQHTVSIQSSPAERPKVRQFNMYASNAITYLMPSDIKNEPDWSVMAQLYEGLVRLDANGDPAPGVAESWQSSKDGLTWTFRLRENARWSDGSPVTASDFVSGWRRMLYNEPRSKWSSLFEGIRGVHDYLRGTGSSENFGFQAVDNRTFTVQLEHPMPWLPALAAEPMFAPLKEISEEERRRDPYGQPFLTNGPFQVRNWRMMYDMQLEKAPMYWDRDHVQIDEIHIQLLVPRNETLLAQLYDAGAADILAVRTAQASVYQNHPDRQTVLDKSTAFLLYNEAHPVLKNANIRRALHDVINPQEFVKQVLPEQAIAADGLVAWGIRNGLHGNYSRVVETGQEQESPNAAAANQRLFTGLKELGLTQLPPLTLLIEESSYSESISRYLTQKWKTVLGIDVQVKTLGYLEKVQALDAKSYDIAISTWQADYNDPMSFLDLLAHDNPYNQTGYNNPAYEKLLKEANTAPYPATRYRKLGAADSLALADAAVTPLFYGVRHVLVKPAFKGFDYNGSGIYFDLKQVRID